MGSPLSPLLVWQNPQAEVNPCASHGHLTKRGKGVSPCSQELAFPGIQHSLLVDNSCTEFCFLPGEGNATRTVATLLGGFLPAGLGRCPWKGQQDRAVPPLTQLLLPALPREADPPANQPSLASAEGGLKNPGVCVCALAAIQEKLNQLILRKSSVSQGGRDDGCWHPPSSLLTSELGM